MAMKNKTRRALVLSVLSLILCCSMLVGTTFAWFTDSATSGVNTINAGNLDIALYYAPAVDENGSPVTSVDKDDWLPVESTTSLFNEKTLWEPGHVQAVYLKAVNEGSLALKYQLGVNIVGETTSTSVLGNEIKLSDYLMVDLHLADELPTYDSREAAATDEHGSWPIPGMPSYHKKLSEIEMGEASLEKGEEIFASVAIYMPTTVGNEANYAKDAAVPTIKMGIMVNATQFTSEKDTYGDDYDKDAAFPNLVSNTADLDSMLSAGNDVTLAKNMNFNASETTANSGYGATGVSVKGGTLDGNGKSLGINNWGTWDAAVHTTGGTIKNLTINSGMRGIFMGSATSDVYIDYVTIDGTIYTFNSDGGSKDYGVYISNSTLNGWTSHSDVHKEVVYTNCEFGEGRGYAFCRPYGPTQFIGCNFAAGYTVDSVGAVTFENCTIGGVALTDANLTTLVTGNVGNATVK